MAAVTLTAVNVAVGLASKHQLELVEPVVGLPAHARAWQVGPDMYYSPASVTWQQLPAASLHVTSVVTAAAAVLPCRGG